MSYKIRELGEIILSYGIIGDNVYMPMNKSNSQMGKVNKLEIGTSLTYLSWKTLAYKHMQETIDSTRTVNHTSSET